MIVYDTMNKGPNGAHILRIAPAAIDKTAELWRDANGDPETIEVPFRNGVATVDDSLGRFLLTHGYARKKRALIHA